MTATVLALIAVSAVLVIAIGALFCFGIALGVALACGVAFFYRKMAPRPAMPMMQHYNLPPEIVRKQKEIVAKVKGLYDGKISGRQQEIIDQELEKVILGK